MVAKLRLVVGTFMGLGLMAGNMGGGCSTSGLFPILPIPGDSGDVIVLDSVDVVFNNETPYDVDAIVNGGYVLTVPAGSITSPVTFDCGVGTLFDFDGDLVTGIGNLPSQNVLAFDEGTQFFCGDLIQVNFFQDAGGTLTLDGFATGP